MNYQEMEQSHWVCYQLPHNAYYYGEVAYLDEHGVVHPKDNAEVAANPKCKLIRHGFGIYLYDCQATIPSRYEVNDH